MATNRRRVVAAIAALLLLPELTGCYTYTPLWSGTPVPGNEVRLGITDQGRVALAGTIGPGVRRVTGRLAGVTDSAYALSMKSVVYIDDAAPTKWNGEPVTIAKSYVGEVSQRQLSKTRSWIAVGVVAGIVAIVSTIAINGFGDNVGDTKVGSGPPQTQ